MNLIRIYITVILVSLTLVNCSKSRDKKQENKVLNIEPQIEHLDGSVSIPIAEFESESFSLTSLEQESFGSKISSTGVIDVPPNGRAIISAHIGGYVKNSPLLIGDQVKKGALLLTIENIAFLELQQEYLEASEQLKFLKSDYERQKELFDENISSEKSFLKAESDYKKTLATYSALKRKLQLLRIDPTQVELGNLTSISKIYAPMSGNITEINVSTGAYVSSSDPIMEIVNTEHLHLELKIFEKDMLDIRIGQTVLFDLPESGVAQYKGKVHLIGKSIGKDRTVKVHAHIDEAQKTNFIPGMFVQASILTGEALGIGIVHGAVTEINNEAFVLLLQSGDDEDTYVFEKVEVDLGTSVGDFILIENEDALDLRGKYLVGGGYLYDTD